MRTRWLGPVLPILLGLGCPAPPPARRSPLRATPEQRLRSPDPAARIAAIGRLSRRGDEAAIRALSSALHDRNARVRAAALRAVQALPDERCLRVLFRVVERAKGPDLAPVTAALAERIRRADPARRRIALTRLLRPALVDGARLRPGPRQTLDRIGAPAVPLILVALAHARGGRPASKALIRHLQDLLVTMGRRAIRPLVAAIRQGNDHREPGAAAVAPLSRLGPPAARALVRLLGPKDPVQLYAESFTVDALARMKATALPALLAAWKGAPDASRARLAKVLGRVGDRCGLPPLLAGLRSKNRALRLACVEALARLGDRRAVAPILAALRQERPRQTPLRPARWLPWVHALAPLGLKAAQIRPLLTHGAPNVRLVGVLLAGPVRNPSLEPALAALARDPAVTVARAAMEILGQRQDARVLPALLRALRHRSPVRRRLAARALGRLGQRTAAPALRRAVGDRNPEVRIAALHSLTWLGDRRALPLARRLARHPDGRLRREAQRAMTILGHGRPASRAPRDICHQLVSRVKECMPHPHGAPRDPEGVQEVLAACRKGGRALFREPCLYRRACRDMAVCLLGEAPGPRHGLVTTWTDFDRKRRDTQGQLRDGKRDGLWQAWWPNGRLRWRGRYARGQQDGLLRTWHDNGRRARQVRYRQGQREGEVVRWAPNGQRLSVRHYRGGKRHGRFMRWYPDGSPRQESAYVNGKRHGRWQAWYRNGRLKFRSPYRDGQREGRRERWYENGRRRSTTHFRRGRRHGPCQRWYENGNRKARGVYVRGAKTGRWVYWRPDGALDRTCWHRPGRPPRCTPLGR